MAEELLYTSDVKEPVERMLRNLGEMIKDLNTKMSKLPTNSDSGEQGRFIADSIGYCGLIIAMVSKAGKRLAALDEALND